MNGQLRNLHEKRAKAALIKYLLSKNTFEGDTVLINELSLDNYSRRADLVVVNGSIQLFEIKSEADTLARLPGQVKTFSRFCDKLHVVSAPCHIAEILSSTPDNIAVWQLDHKKGIKVVRRGRKVPLKNKDNLLKMVNVRELRQFLSKEGIKADTQLRRHLVSAAESNLSVKEIRLGVLQALKERYTKTTEQFLGLATKQGVSSDHIESLKRSTSSYQNNSIHQETNSHCEDDVYLLQLANETKGALFGPLPHEIRKLFKST